MTGRDNAGTLSRNRKRENDRQPEFRGSCLIDGHRLLDLGVGQGG